MPEMVRPNLVCGASASIWASAAWRRARSSFNDVASRMMKSGSVSACSAAAGVR